MGAITPDELAARLQEAGDGVRVLDVRHGDEFEEWHIPGSDHVDVYDQLQADPDRAKEQLAALPDDEEIVTICAAGVVSETATDVLEELGYEASTLVDGMRGWSRVHRSAPVDVDIDGQLIQVTRPGKGCLSYVLVSDGEAAVFDASRFVEEYEAILDDHDAKLVGTFDTHAHADHVSGSERLADRAGVPYSLHPADALDIEAEPLADGDTFAVGDVEVSVIHTPGHSQGGVTFAVEDAALLTGDTLFHESVGRVELGVEVGIEDTDVEANAETLYESLQRLLAVEGDPLVLPSHDPGSPEPPVTARLSEVRERNDDLHLDRAAFVERLANDIPDHPPNFERVKGVNVGREHVDEDELADLELGPNRCAAE
jgi:glyoxylase-like metal-dependent hydrolase (beta-lactamase superfamily II)/rhodanese-related sulfurtransferase